MIAKCKKLYGRKNLILVLVVIILTAGSVGLSPVAYAAGESVVVPNAAERNITAAAGQSEFIAPNIVLSNFGFNILSAKLVIENLPGDATTSYTDVPGLTVSYDSGKSVYTITGEAAASDYQTLFRSFKINCGTTLRNDIKFNFLVSENTTTPMYYSGTGHYYEYISKGVAPIITWTDAAAAASAKTYNGMEGYLVTIMSEGENTFTINKMSGSGWIGISDADANGSWYWSTGPEAGTYFWEGYYPGEVSPEGGYYNNWYSSEPNRDSLVGNYGHLFVNSPGWEAYRGYWNDMPDSNEFVQGYVVEYGDMPGDAPEDFDETVTVNIGATVTYNANGAISGDVPVDNNNPYASGSDVTVLTNSGTLKMSGYIFDGWNTQADGNGTNYDASGTDTFAISSNTILYARWEVDSDGDGVGDDDEVSAGTNPNDPNDKPQKGSLIVTVYQQDGSPAAGLTCVLNSTPVVITTDAIGRAIFSDVNLAPHTLKLLNGTVLLGTYSLDFTKGTGNSTDITDNASTDSEGSVNTIVAEDFQSLNLMIQRNGSNFWQIGDAKYNQNTGTAEGIASVVNPQTGDYRIYFNNLWIWMLAAAVLIGSCVVTFITVKKKSIK